ncbi:hypothetical protein FS842_003393 [Serendipita sp. 407]|nr:hypothetical protein FS842_003393 [Serendipita sp. 407]
MEHVYWDNSWATHSMNKLAYPPSLQVHLHTIIPDNFKSWLNYPDQFKNITSLVLRRFHDYGQCSINCHLLHIATDIIAQCPRLSFLGLGFGSGFFLQDCDGDFIDLSPCFHLRELAIYDLRTAPGREFSFILSILNRIPSPGALEQLYLRFVDPDGAIDASLTHIFAKYCTPALNLEDRPPGHLLVPIPGSFWTEEALDKWAIDTNGQPLPPESKEDIIENLDVNEDNCLLLGGFLQLYALQTSNDENETWRDLEKHGFDRSLQLRT